MTRPQDEPVGIGLFGSRLLPPLAVDAGRVVGRWSFYHDGWPERLNIEQQPDGTYRGRLRSSLFQGDYAAAVTVGGDSSHHVVVVVDGFNEMAQQRFDGYLFARGTPVMAGRTQWKDEPFGFYARKSTLAPLSPALRAGVSSNDFAGTWSLYCDGLFASLRLVPSGGRRLSGTLVERDGTMYEVTGSVDEAVAHQVALSIHTTAVHGAEVKLTGYLWSRQRNALAGLLAQGDVQTGWYATRAGN